MKIIFHNKQAGSNLPKLQVNGDNFTIAIPTSNDTHCTLSLHLATYSGARIFFNGKLQLIDFEFENEVNPPRV